MKKTIIVFMLIMIIFSAVPVYAEGQAGVDEGGPLERIVAGIIEVPIKIVKYLASKADIKPIEQLVFLNGVPDDERKTTPWKAGEIKFIQLWYLAMGGIAMPIFLLVIIITAYKLMLSGVNPGTRSEAIESIWRWFGALMIMIIAPLLVQALMNLVTIILDGIQAGYVAVSNAAGIQRPVSDWGQVNFDNIVTGSVLGTAIVKCMLFFIYLWLNAIYLVRKLALSVMLCFTPLMAIMWALNKNVNAMAIWAGELASNAFMPVAHALVLCLILGLCDVKNIGSGSWFTILVFMYALMPLAEIIRNSMQNLFARASGLDESGVASGALTAAIGMGGLASLARVGKSTFQGIGSAKGGIMPDGTSKFTGTAASTGATSGSATAADFLGQPGEERPPGEPPKWANYTTKGIGAVGVAAGSVIGLASGVIPGGREIGGLIGGATVKSTRFVGAVGTMLGMALQNKIINKQSYAQSLREVTNTGANGFKGTTEAIRKVGQIGYDTAKSGIFEPARTISKPPARGLK